MERPAVNNEPPLEQSPAAPPRLDWWRREYAWLAVAGLMVATFSIAVFQLGRDSFWGDEAYTWALTRAADPHRWTTDATHPHLYYVLLDLWVGLFGASEFWLRFPSVIATVLTLPVVFLIGRVVHSPRAGLFAALLVATSPFIVHYARDARSYAMLVFLCSAAFLCLTLLLKGKDVGYGVGSSVRSLAAGRGFDRGRVETDLLWLGLAASTLAAMLTHFVAMLLPVLTVSVVLATAAVDERGRKQLVVNALAVQFAVLALWLVHPFGATDFLASPGGVGFHTPLTSKAHALIVAYGSGHFQPAFLLPLGCALAATWHWYKRREWKWLALTLLCWLGAPGISTLSEFVVDPTFKRHVFLWTSVPFFVLVAVGLCRVAKRWVAVFLLGTMLLFNLFGVVMEYRTTHPPWDLIVNEIERGAEDGDALLLCNVQRALLKVYYPSTSAPRLELYPEPKGNVPPLDSVPYDTVWILTMNGGSCGSGPQQLPLTAVLKEWGIQTHHWKAEYGASGLSVRVGELMSKTGVGYPPGRVGHVALYKVGSTGR